MNPRLVVGLASKASLIVTPEMSPPHLPRILATSRIISFLEDTCLYAVEPLLDDAQTTVGTRVDLAHVGMARAGQEVEAHIRLVRITGHRLLSFAVEVTAPAGVIATGVHQRLVVEKSRFLKT